ncbi:MAG: hypothetical protein AAF891_07710, partial [Pseudomonadota bacterium]
VRQAMDWLRAETWVFRLLPALLGAATGMGLASYINGAPVWVLSGHDVVILTLVGLGGAFGGYLMSGWIGRPGLFGAGLTAFGCWLAGGLGGALAGTIFDLFTGTFFGAMAGILLPFIALPVFAAWVLSCVALHVVLAFARSQRVAP